MSALSPACFGGGKVPGEDWAQGSAEPQAQAVVGRGACELARGRQLTHVGAAESRLAAAVPRACRRRLVPAHLPIVMQSAAARIPACLRARHLSTLGNREGHCLLTASELFNRAGLHAGQPAPLVPTAAAPRMYLFKGPRSASVVWPSGGRHCDRATGQASLAVSGWKRLLPGTFSARPHGPRGSGACSE